MQKGRCKKIQLVLNAYSYWNHLEQFRKNSVAKKNSRNFVSLFFKKEETLGLLVATDARYIDRISSGIFTPKSSIFICCRPPAVCDSIL